MAPLFIKAPNCLQSPNVSHTRVGSRFWTSADVVVVVAVSPLLLCRIVLSTPLAVLSYFLIWYVPPFEDGKVIWYLFFYCIFQTLQTVSTRHTHTQHVLLT